VRSLWLGKDEEQLGKAPQRRHLGWALREDKVPCGKKGRGRQCSLRITPRVQTQERIQ
jgi:hypothetical protein